MVLYERVTFGKLDTTSEEYLALVEIAEGRMTFAESRPGRPLHRGRRVASPSSASG